MQKYDRQERLWSKTGQQDLTDSHVWAIGNSLTLRETLKNLVLAGVGRITVNSDPNCQAEHQIGNMGRNLSNLNPDVVVVETRRPASSADVIIKALAESNEVEDCDSEQVPRILVGSNGMLGFVTIRFDGMTSFPIVEPHPSSGLADLRLKPSEIWPEYQEFCDSIRLDLLDEFTHRHVPHCVLLAKAAAQVEENARIKDRLKLLERFPNEDNFSEARKNIWRLNSCSVPPGLSELFEYAKTRGSKEGPDAAFWDLVEVLNGFVKRYGCLPVSGIIPDMISNTDMYRRLESIYKKKAEADIDTMMQLSAYALPRETVGKFCQNARHLRAFVPDTTLNAENLENHAEQHLIASGGAELAPTAALIGGMAAQEAIKVITGQYTPISGTLIFNGDKQSTKLLRGNYRLIN